jgi:hypothetical protein
MCLRFQGRALGKGFALSCVVPASDCAGIKT